MVILNIPSEQQVVNALAVILVAGVFLAFTLRDEVGEWFMATVATMIAIPAVLGVAGLILFPGRQWDRSPIPTTWQGILTCLVIYFIGCGVIARFFQVRLNRRAGA